MNEVSLFFKNPIVRKVLIFSIIGFILFLLRGLFNIILLTFIFTFLLYNVQSFLVTSLQRVVKVQRKIVIILLYAAVAAGICFILIRFTPVLVKESVAIIKQAYSLYKDPGENVIAKYIVIIMQKIQLKSYIDQGVDLVFSSAKKLSAIGVDIILSFLLSLFFSLEKKRVFTFASRFRSSKLGFIYEEIAYFGKKFTASFGKVMQTQIFIALINCLLSVIGLWILGFPKILGLAVMVFFLGLIPVAGVIISLIPLSMIAFNIGGLTSVAYVFLMIIILHAMEAYVLNPRLMSTKTDLPIFFIFLTLIISEYVIGPWGLVIGIPLFVFFLDIFDVTYKKESPIFGKILPQRKESKDVRKANKNV